jgi:hypothetical protein
MNSYKTPLGLAAYLLAYLAPYPHLVTAVPWLWKLLAQLTWPEVRSETGNQLRAVLEGE